MTTMTPRELSPRQREILALVAAGRTSKEIAGTLGISESTVNWHLSNAFERLGASSRAEAVALAMREGAELADDQKAVATPGPARPQLPMSSVALAVAVTLVLGLLGGALMAGWDFTLPIAPFSSAAASEGGRRSVEPTSVPTMPLPIAAPPLERIAPLTTAPTIPASLPVPSVPFLPPVAR